MAKDSFIGSGMLLVTQKIGDPDDANSLTAKLLRGSTQSGVFSEEEVQDILIDLGVSQSRSDSDRIIKNLLREKYLERL